MHSMRSSYNAPITAGNNTNTTSTLRAIPKGRVIGTVDKPDSSTAEKKKQRPNSDQLDEPEVISLRLKPKDGHVLVEKKAGEGQ
jgi:hypothetical protein